ncbi:MAG: bifunctional UDP-N-acetylglucosamine diphosphorylase/glucosamine-1-phosphate N-acetyltransferase GlmU [Clostridiales bacterium]|nr:bifunctional UDP-N-acetylglucosamine diphosphorylase/glucosamine-1-phosphate N-acetyltransferase GlmU [Clostridiales bacterium]
MREKKCAIILAGGKGSRMKTSRPKVLCNVLMEPMISYVLDAVRGAGCTDICVVTGYARQALEAYLPDGIETAYQAERLGTGHAVMQCGDFIARHRDWEILILNGDGPMIDADTLLEAYRYHKDNRHAMTLISAVVEDPAGIGHIKRSEDGVLERIVEHRDANDEEKRIKEANAGMYWFQGAALEDALSKITNDNAQREYYLTDTLAITIAAGRPAGGYVAQDAEVTLGANDRKQLQDLNARMRRRILDRLMADGVDIPCADGVIIGKDVEIGADTTILPGTVMTGKSVIGSGCVVGPNCYIQNSVIGKAARLNGDPVYDSAVGTGCDAGPFVQVRAGSKLAEGVHIGDFVEVKNSVVGAGTKSAHLTYIGDSDVGAGVNFGCGTVTVNYDGKHKSRTVIGNNAFIGCNTNLIAPVSVGENAYIAAGSTITDNIPADALSIARARQVNKEGWVARKKPYKEKK